MGLRYGCVCGEFECVRARVCVRAHVCAHACERMCAGLCACACACVHMCMCMCVFVYMHACLFACLFCECACISKIYKVHINRAIKLKTIASIHINFTYMQRRLVDLMDDFGGTVRLSVAL